MRLPPPEGKTCPDGAEVSFRMNGYNAYQAGSFRPGANLHLDLTASTNFAVASRDFWPIVGLATGLLSPPSLTYYLVLLRRVLRKRVGRKR